MVYPLTISCFVCEIKSECTNDIYSLNISKAIHSWTGKNNFGIVSLYQFMDNISLNIYHDCSVKFSQKQQT